MDMLETGVVLCQLAKELQERMIFASNGKVLTPKFISYHTYCNFFLHSRTAQSTTEPLLFCL